MTVCVIVIWAVDQWVPVRCIIREREYRQSQHQIRHFYWCTTGGEYWISVWMRKDCGGQGEEWSGKEFQLLRSDIMWSLCSARYVPTNTQGPKNGGYVPCEPKNRGYVPGGISANRRNRGYVPDRDFANRHEEWLSISFSRANLRKHMWTIRDYYSFRKTLNHLLL